MAADGSGDVCMDDAASSSGFSGSCGRRSPSPDPLSGADPAADLPPGPVRGPSLSREHHSLRDRVRRDADGDSAADVSAAAAAMRDLSVSDAPPPPARAAAAAEGVWAYGGAGGAPLERFAVTSTPRGLVYEQVLGGRRLRGVLRCPEHPKQCGAPAGVLDATEYPALRADVAGGTVWLKQESPEELGRIFVDSSCRPIRLDSSEPVAELCFAEGGGNGDICIRAAAQPGALIYTVNGVPRPPVRSVDYDDTDLISFPELYKRLYLPRDDIPRLLGQLRGLCAAAGVSCRIPAVLPHGVLRRDAARRDTAPLAPAIAVADSAPVPRPLQPPAAAPAAERAPPAQSSAAGPAAESRPGVRFDVPPGAGRPPAPAEADAAAAAAALRRAELLLAPYGVTRQNFFRRRAAAALAAERLSHNGDQQAAYSVLCALELVAASLQRACPPQGLELTPPDARPDEADCRRRVYAMRKPPPCRAVRALTRAESEEVEERNRQRRELEKVEELLGDAAMHVDPSLCPED
eukprot:TRINITY_DN7838_c0_g1_i1.p1 TRINITY_DN7838_c0_g1~~TRINITY_DN7838_c0_g1_i1.p1  ORF type:complete len:548 (+),score=139.98 TRINITY_DN7838_c0_g1_i1:87-1646(+)